MKSKAQPLIITEKFNDTFAEVIHQANEPLISKEKFSDTFAEVIYETDEIENLTVSQIVRDLSQYISCTINVISDKSYLASEKIRLGHPADLVAFSKFFVQKEIVTHIDKFNPLCNVWYETSLRQIELFSLKELRSIIISIELIGIYTDLTKINKCFRKFILKAANYIIHQTDVPEHELPEFVGLLCHLHIFAQNIRPSFVQDNSMQFLLCYAGPVAKKVLTSFNIENIISVFSDINRLTDILGQDNITDKFQSIFGNMQIFYINETNDYAGLNKIMLLQLLSELANTLKQDSFYTTAALRMMQQLSHDLIKQIDYYGAEELADSLYYISIVIDHTDPKAVKKIVDLDLIALMDYSVDQMDAVSSAIHVVQIFSEYISIIPKNSFSTIDNYQPVHFYRSLKGINALYSHQVINFKSPETINFFTAWQNLFYLKIARFKIVDALNMMLEINKATKILKDDPIIDLASSYLYLVNQATLKIPDATINDLIDLISYVYKVSSSLNLSLEDQWHLPLYQAWQSQILVQMNCFTLKNFEDSIISVTKLTTNHNSQSIATYFYQFFNTWPTSVLESKKINYINSSLILDKLSTLFETDIIDLRRQIEWHYFLEQFQENIMQQMKKFNFLKLVDLIHFLAQVSMKMQQQDFDFDKLIDSLHSTKSVILALKNNSIKEELIIALPIFQSFQKESKNNINHHICAKILRSIGQLSSYTIPGNIKFVFEDLIKQGIDERINKHIALTIHEAQSIIYSIRQLAQTHDSDWIKTNLTHTLKQSMSVITSFYTLVSSKDNNSDGNLSISFADVFKEHQDSNDHISIHHIKYLSDCIYNMTLINMLGLEQIMIFESLGKIFDYMKEINLLKYHLDATQMHQILLCDRYWDYLFIPSLLSDEQKIFCTTIPPRPLSSCDQTSLTIIQQIQNYYLDYENLKVRTNMWIGEIGAYVDIFICEKNHIIQIARPQNYQLGGELSQASKLLQYILEKIGYTFEWFCQNHQKYFEPAEIEGTVDLTSQEDEVEFTMQIISQKPAAKQEVTIEQSSKEYGTEQGVTIDEASYGTSQDYSVDCAKSEYGDFQFA